MTQVWCAELFTNLEAFAFYECPATTSDERKALMRLSARNRFGYELSPEDIPPRVMAVETPPEQLKELALIVGRLPMISRKLADLLKGLDIGASKFFETDFFAQDGIEALDYNHLFWNLGNRKDTLVAEACRDIFLSKGPAGRKVAEAYASSKGIEDDDLAVTSEALIGADFWIESKFPETVFFSARFENLLSENGILELFCLQSVRVL